MKKVTLLVISIIMGFSFSVFAKGNIKKMSGSSNASAQQNCDGTGKVGGGVQKGSKTGAQDGTGNGYGDGTNPQPKDGTGFGASK